MEKYVKPSIEVINLVLEQSILDYSKDTYGLPFDDGYNADDDYR